MTTSNDEAPTANVDAASPTEVSAPAASQPTTPSLGAYIRESPANLREVLELSLTDYVFDDAMACTDPAHIEGMMKRAEAELRASAAVIADATASAKPMSIRARLSFLITGFLQL